jgi:peptide/nickel transport system substrate-binding protein
MLLVSMVLGIFVLSSFAISPAKAAVVMPTNGSLNKITFVDYGGNDASGTADLIANKIDIYNFQLTPSAAASLPSSYHQVVSPGSLYGLYINPQNTTKGFNPFYFQKVRFALNYLIDRNYFSQTIEGGKFVPSISAVSAEPDTVTVSTGQAPFSNVTYNLQFANQTITSVLTANGATYTGGHWMYKGKAISIGLFDRIDDPIRHSFMQYLNSQLQGLGFTTNLISGTLSDAETVVFGSDPVNATWNIYPASNSQIYGYYDSNAINFYSAGYYNDLPASDHYGANWIGGWDNTTQEAYSTSLYDKADTYAIPLLQSNFSTIAQRNALLSNLAYYGVLGATYITLGTSLAPQGTNSAVSGITGNFLTDTIANYQDYLTMTVSGSGATATANSIKIGVRHITNGATNPVGGDNDAYGDNMQAANAFPIYAYGPSTAYPYSTGMTFKVNANSFSDDVAVPTTAIFFNGSADQWQNVAAGTKGQNDVTVDFSKYLSHTTWADGQPVTLADMLMQYIEMARVVTPGNPLSDSGGEHGLYSTEYSQVQGIKVVNSTALELFTTGTFFPDPNYAAIGVIADVASPLGYSGYTDGFGLTPWQMYYAMNQVVSNGQAAWSTATATKKSIPWLSVLNPTDVGNIKTALTAAGSTIPAELAQLQTMTGQSWVTSATASAGYTAAVNFINTNGVALISDGAYYVSQYSSSTSPAFLVMSKNPGFQGGSVGNQLLFAPAVVLSPQAAIPPVLSAGGSFTVTALQTADGAAASTATPAPGANVIVNIVQNGSLSFSKNYTTDANGKVSVQIPQNLKAGTYQMSIFTYSQTSTLVQPIVQTLVLSAATATSSSTSASTSISGSTTSTSSTTTTSSSNSTLYILAGVVVVIVIVVAFAFTRRRGKGGA